MADAPQVQPPMGLLVGKPAFLAEERRDAREKSKSSSRGSSKDSARKARQMMGPPALLQIGNGDEEVSPEVRTQFVLKVYGLLAIMLTVTFSITAPFVFCPEDTLEWFQFHRWVLVASGVVVALQYGFNMYMMCQLVCCGPGPVYNFYTRMFSRLPFNYMFLTLYSVCLGVLAGNLCAYYKATTVLMMSAMTLALIPAISVFAACTKADFSGMGCYATVMGIGLCLMILFGTLFPLGSVGHRVLAGAGAVVFGCIIIFDSQQICGSASWRFGTRREVRYSEEMHAFAAWCLYLDFVSFPLYLPQCLTNRR